MKKRYWFFVIILLLLIFLSRSFDYFSADIKSSTPVLGALQDNKSDDDENVNSKHTKVFEQSVKVGTVEVEPRVLFEKSSEEKVPTQMPTTEKEAFEFLNTKNHLKPEAEFANLKELAFDLTEDLNVQNPLMSPGAYVDKAAKIAMVFLAEGDTGVLGAVSCLKLKEAIPLVLMNENFQVRDDGTGYVAVMVEDVWYIRMKHIEGQMVGKIFKKDDGQWRFLEDFSATNVSMYTLAKSDLSKACQTIAEKYF